MSIDMERSRDSYRGRYRDRHHNSSPSRNNDDDRLTRGSYRGRPSHDNDRNSNYSSRSSPNNGYNYRSARTSLNSRPVLSRNGPSMHHHRSDDYPLPSHSSSLSHRSSGNHTGQPNYFDNHSLLPPSSRFDRPSNHRDIYRSLLGEQPILSNGPSSPSSLYYSSSSSSFPLVRDRALPAASSQYLDTDHNRYLPPLSSSYRRDESPPLVSSYRNERSMNSLSRNVSNDVYMRGDYRPPSLAPVPTRVDPYADTYRTNMYNARSERYDILSNRNTASSRDHPMPTSSSTYRTDMYRSSSNVSMSSPLSSYSAREQYPSDSTYRSMSQSRDYENASSLSRTSSMDHQDDFSRNSRDRSHNDYHSSHRNRPNLKRPSSRYNDDGPTPSKRPMRR